MLFCLKIRSNLLVIIVVNEVSYGEGSPHRVGLSKFDDNVYIV